MISEKSCIICELHCEKDRKNAIVMVFVPRIKQWTCCFTEVEDDVCIELDADQEDQWYDSHELFHKVMDLVEKHWKKFSKRDAFYFESLHPSPKLDVSWRSKSLFSSLYSWINKVERYSFCFECCAILNREQRRNFHHTCSNECLSLLKDS